VLASRIASTTSLGEEKILYMLGGTDNWMFPQFDMTIPLPQGENFVYRSMATNLRGFRLNARNGNSYALLNTEIRMPVLKYIFQRSRSSFINNFQLIGFFDAGTAWQGLNPFDEKSPLNTWTSSNNNVTIKVNYFRDPVVLGYGAGIRTLLFGYFLRLDYGWGVETRKVQDPKLYFSVGLDF
jgi:outer membrane protein assembly factor BamA